MTFEQKVVDHGDAEEALPRPDVHIGSLDADLQWVELRAFTLGRQCLIVGCVPEEVVAAQIVG